MGLVFIMGSLITMHLIVKILKETTYCSFHFVIVLPCYPECTMSFFLESYSDRIEYISFLSRSFSMFPKCHLPWLQKAGANITTLKITIISVSFLNYSYGPAIYRDISKMNWKKELHVGSQHKTFLDGREVAVNM